ncbi:SAF domain-containing protein [Paenibacillus sp. M1]|uniref:SAF domain-containing protein n=1 Tax=Paenibacillus haidiansis TaxID=1574488 RepID=A0ABU7VU37_9BACL
MFRLRRRTKQLLYAGLLGALIAALAVGGYTFVHNKEMNAAGLEVRQRLEEEIRGLKEAKDRQTVQGWAPAREIKAGHVIGSGDVIPVELPEGSVPADLVKSRDSIAGKIAKLTLAPNTLLTDTLLYEEEPASDDLRYREMGFIQLPAALREQDFIDIRIQFPTGQDYILLSKKKVGKLSSSGTVTTTLNEAEILSLSSAIVDAYMHKASIYALLYVEPGLQVEAVPTYPVNEAVLQLIKKDPNIVERAEHALTQSARAGLEADLAGMSSQAAAEFAGLQAEAAASPGNGGDDGQFVMDAPE